jgi:hypothetical protein
MQKAEFRSTPDEWRARRTQGRAGFSILHSAFCLLHSWLVRAKTRHWRYARLTGARDGL